MLICHTSVSDADRHRATSKSQSGWTKTCVVRLSNSERVVKQQNTTFYQPVLPPQTPNCRSSGCEDGLPLKDNSADITTKLGECALKCGRQMVNPLTPRDMSPDLRQSLGFGQKRSRMCSILKSPFNRGYLRHQEELRVPISHATGSGLFVPFLGS